MKSTFIFATFFAAALAAPAPMKTLPNDVEMCGLNLSFCLGSPQGYCKCEHDNIDDVNERLAAKGCTEKLHVSRGCRGIYPPRPFNPTGTMGAMPMGTGTAAFPMGTGTPTLGDGTKSCGRGQPRCPSGYTCREKWPGKVADAMYCFMDRPRGHATSMPQPEDEPAPQRCGGIMGKVCPKGYWCSYGHGPAIPIADQMGYCKKMPTAPGPQKPHIGTPVDAIPVEEAPAQEGEPSVTTTGMMTIATAPNDAMTVADAATPTPVVTPVAGLDQV